MGYGAITLDTSIFDQKSLKLETGILKTLEQFKGKPSPLILSEIVIREVHAHLKRNASEARARITKAVRDSITGLSISQDNSDQAIELLIPQKDDSEVASDKLLSFIKNTGAEIVRVSGHVELNDIVRKYFNSDPPFAESGNKKTNFRMPLH